MRPITARDLMNPRVLTIPAEMDLKEAARFLVDNEITGAPVEDHHGQLVGLLSVVDIARVAAGLVEPAEGDGAAPANPGSGVAGFAVADAMTPALFSVEADARVAEVAALMLRHHLHRLLVTEDGKPVGVVTSSDLLGLLVEVQ
jgi:CBS domain-containing protein